LARGGVEIGAEALVVDARRGPEHRHRRLRCDKAVATKRSQLTDRHAVARHDERFPPIELAHDLSALVAQLSLGDLAAHVVTVARCATDPPSASPPARDRLDHRPTRPEIWPLTAVLWHATTPGAINPPKPGPRGLSNQCLHSFGGTTPFDMDTLARLNRFHESYVEAYTASNRGRGRRRLHPRT